MAFLTATNGPQAGKQYEIEPSTETYVMGRHPDCQIIVDVGAVSRYHAQILCEDGNFFVEDLKSRNGTYLNEEQLEARQKLADGDSVRICDISFAFQLDSQPAIPLPEQKSLDASSSGSMGVVLVDDSQDSGSTIMSKLDVTSQAGRVQLTASPEAKLDALLEITKSLGKALALDEVLPGVLDSLFKIFVQADRGFIVMEESNGDIIPLWTKVRREDSEDSMRISRTIIKRVMESKEAILSADAASDERFEMSQSIADFRIRSMMCAPLLDSEGNSIGALQVDTLDQRKRFQQEDLEVLASVAAQAGISITNARMYEDSIRQKAIERDLEVAHDVQKSFLPQEAPAIDGYTFYNYYKPAHFVGGDYYDYIELPEGRVAIIVADVVGHGIAAALLMAKLAAEAKFSLASESDESLAIGRLNDAMSNLQMDRFVTFIMAMLDSKKHEVTIVNAGHMAPLVRKPDGSVEEPGEELAGLPVGIMDGVEFESLTLKLEPGEVFTMYTDGVNECSDASDKMYGIERMRELIRDAKTATPESLGSTIIEDVKTFLAGGQQDDDMCLVSFGRCE